MKDNGFVGVEMNTVRARLALPSASDALRLLQECAGAYRAVVADLSDKAKSMAWDEVRECLTHFKVNGRLDLEAIIGSGARPTTHKSA